MVFSFIISKKALFGFFIFSFLFLIQLSSVIAIGASPAYVRTDYSDNFNETFSFVVINNNPDPNIEVELSLRGPLAEYAHLSEDSFYFEKKMHGFKVYFDFPDYENLGVYGPQKLFIRATEVAKQGGMFVVGTSVEIWVQVYIPLPGNFAEVSVVDVENAFQGDDTLFNFTLTNRGSDAIYGSSAKLYIKDYSGKNIDTLSFRNIDIPYGGKVSFYDTLETADYTSGKYEAQVEYIFSPDFAPSKKSDIFFLGSSDVIITNYTAELVAGEINRVIITAQSLWGSALKDVDFLLTYNNRPIYLPPVDFNPFEEIRFEAFIEAPLIEDKKTDSIPLNAFLDISIPLGNGSVVEKEVPLSFTVVNKKGSFSMSSQTMFIVGGILIVLILVLVNFFILSKVNNKKSTKKK